MYYFKQKLFGLKELLSITNAPRLVVIHKTCSLASLLSLSLLLYACSSPNEIQRNLIKRTKTAQSATVSGAVQGKAKLTGSWKIGCRYNGKTELANMQIEQSNDRFSGLGIDDSTKAHFKIEQGTIKADEVLFLKKYDIRPNQPVQYHGKFSYLSSSNGQIPYMGGDFSFESNGALSTGEWEAVIEQPVSQAQVLSNDNESKASEENSTNEQANDSQRYPDLSGKWNTAFEYNFKTIHSTMFLEQDGHHIAGHGTDSDTKEKFTISKGWYSFPNLTIVRLYPSRAGTNKLVTFKATVSEVNEADYKGPYLSGKTQGGGLWEAERVN